MRKLKLDSLTVESFATMPVVRVPRGTMYAHQQYVASETYDPRDCGETQYFDCTYDCHDSGCMDTCGATGYDC